MIGAAASGTQNWQVLAGTIAAVTGIAGFLWSVLRHLGGKLDQKIDEKVAPVLAELSHNGGMSLKDQVVATRGELREYKADTGRRFTRVEKQITEATVRIDGLYDRRPKR